MTKRRKKRGLTAFAAIKVRKSFGEQWATLTLEMRSAELEEFLRRVAQDEMSSIPSGHLPEWNDYLLGLLESPPDGRPRKDAYDYPLWVAYEKAKAEDPDLSKRQFVIDHCKLNRRDERSIRAGLSQLGREERMARKTKERMAQELERARQLEEIQNIGLWARKLK
jgi:hypothetical protein